MEAAESSSQVEEISWRKLSFTLLVNPSRTEVLLKRPPDGSPFYTDSLLGSKSQDDVSGCSHVEVPSEASWKLFFEFYYPDCGDKETDPSGERKWRPPSMSLGGSHSILSCPHQLGL